MGDQVEAASFAAGMQIAHEDLREVTEMLAGLACTGHVPPIGQSAKAVRRDLEKMRHLLDESRGHLDAIERSAVKVRSR